MYSTSKRIKRRTLMVFALITIASILIMGSVEARAAWGTNGPIDMKALLMTAGVGFLMAIGVFSMFSGARRSLAGQGKQDELSLAKAKVGHK